MAVTDTTLPEQAADRGGVATQVAPGELEELIGTGDHTSLGRLYMGFSLLLLVVGLAIRALFGVDLAAGNEILGSYVGMVGSSALVALLFLGVLPALVGLAMLVVPLQVGSPSIAFPRAAALSLWTWLISGGLFITSIALDGGVRGGDFDAASLGNLSLGAMMASLGLASVCIATTVVTHRPAGLTLARVPLFTWSMLVAASVWIVTFGAAIAYVVLGHLGADSAPALAENFDAGLAWVLRGPAVYMLAIPVLGIAADTVSHVTRRPLSNYGVFQGLIGAFGILSFGAWALGPESINTVLWAVWALAAAVPVLALLGGLAESMRHGALSVKPALVGSLLSLVVLLGGIAVGVLMALDTMGSGTLFDFEPVALGAAQATFVVAAVVVGLVSGQAHWSGQIWGEHWSAPSTNAAVVLVAAGGALSGLALVVDVFLTSAGTDASTVIGILTAIGGAMMCLGVLGALMASLSATRTAYERGEDEAAPPGPDDGLTLEWQVGRPAVGGERTTDLPADITSPYPLAATEEDR